MNADDDIYSFDTAKQNASNASLVPPSRNIATERQTARTSTARPNTSLNAVGYKSSKSNQNSAVSLQDHGAFVPFCKPAPKTSEEIQKANENEVIALIEESALLNRKEQYDLAHKKAKAAAAKNKQMDQYRQQNDLDPNVELSFCSQFNFAYQLQQNKMSDEALRAYRFITQQKAYTMGGRLHVNMGNIFFQQEKYNEAIKQYQMALDQITSSSQQLRFKIQRNLATCYLRLFKFPEASNALSQIMEHSPDPHAAINLMVCYYAMRDKEKMKELFVEMLSLRREMQFFFQTSVNTNQSLTLAPLEGLAEEEENEPMDELRIEKAKRKQFLDSKIIASAQLIASFTETEFQKGFEWVLKTMRENSCEDLASQMEMIKALQFMKAKQFDKAIETLKSFERKDHSLASSASTNLSFLYFLEGDFKSAENYADAAISVDKLNSRALVNKGNCLAVNSDFQGAIQCYLEALGMDYSCVEAFYNLGLAYKKLGKYDIALKSFQKVTDLIGIDSETTFQMALIHEHLGEQVKASVLYRTLLTLVPSDPGVAAKLGALALKTEHSETEAEAVAYVNYMDAYRFFPSSLPVVSWLGSYYIKSEAFEKAIPFLERAMQLQPDNVHWQLMCASCNRRTGNYQQALEMLEDIHQRFPNNIECVRSLAQICKELDNKREDQIKYETILRKLEKEKYERRQNEEKEEEEEEEEEEEPLTARNMRDIGDDDEDDYAEMLQE